MPLTPGICRATPTKSAAYHFTYMLPNQNREVIEPYNEKGVPFETILPIGMPNPVACNRIAAW
jgi:hypothetical protein